MYEIEWTVKALKQLKRIQAQYQRRIVVAVKALANWPDCKNVKPLTNHRYDYRLRVGRYRVFFTMKDILKIAKIEEVKKRDERTY